MVTFTAPGLLATFGAAGIGALAGSLIGTFVNIGVPEEEAHHYQRELEKGRTIVTDKATSGYDDALAILGVSISNLAFCTLSDLSSREGRNSVR